MAGLTHPPAQRPRRRRGQQGAIIITVAMLMLLLLGFIGAALDFGRLFVIKTELQTAMDSCALSAARELTRQPSSVLRATNAGRTAGNLNNVDFQSTSWGGLGQIVDAEITFRRADYGATSDDTLATYAECRHSQTGAPVWLLQAMGAFSGDSARYPNTQNVTASAVATLGSAQTTCPIPVALRPNAGGNAPNYGFQPGQWVTLIMSQGAQAGGQIGWANLDGSNSASETVEELMGRCGSRIGDRLGTPGVQASVARAWNYRFGIYGGNDGPADFQPDFTGYAYTVSNWPSQANAYNGPPGAGAHATAANFTLKRQSYASCADTGTRVRGGASSCERIIDRSLNSFSRLAAPGPSAAGGHAQFGTNRRIVTVPVVNGASQLIDYACMLMLQPLSIPMRDVQLEFIGNAGDPGSPCVTSGLPGGVAGPRVPVLVR